MILALVSTPAWSTEEQKQLVPAGSGKSNLQNRDHLIRELRERRDMVSAARKQIPTDETGTDKSPLHYLTATKVSGLAGDNDAVNAVFQDVSNDTDFLTDQQVRALLGMSVVTNMLQAYDEKGPATAILQKNQAQKSILNAPIPYKPALVRLGAATGIAGVAWLMSRGDFDPAVTSAFFFTAGGVAASSVLPWVNRAVTQFRHNSNIIAFDKHFNSNNDVEKLSLETLQAANNTLGVYDDSKLVSAALYALLASATTGLWWKSNGITTDGLQAAYKVWRGNPADFTVRECVQDSVVQSCHSLWRATPSTAPVVNFVAPYVPGRNFFVGTAAASLLGNVGLGYGWKRTAATKQQQLQEAQAETEAHRKTIEGDGTEVNIGLRQQVANQGQELARLRTTDNGQLQARIDQLEQANRKATEEYDLQIGQLQQSAQQQMLAATQEFNETLQAAKDEQVKQLQAEHNEKVEALQREHQTTLETRKHEFDVTQQESAREVQQLKKQLQEQATQREEENRVWKQKEQEAIKALAQRQQAIDTLKEKLKAKTASSSATAGETGEIVEETDDAAAAGEAAGTGAQKKDKKKKKSKAKGATAGKTDALGVSTEEGDVDDADSNK